MATVRGVVDALGRRFAASFPPGAAPAWRTLGREAEFPLVHPDGTAADAAALLPILGRMDPTLEEKREGDLLVALKNDAVEFTLEVGKGTIEVVVGPADDLHQLQALHDAARGPLLRAADELGIHVLGYGIQPRTPATPALMTPKERYGVLLDVIGAPWLSFALTASDQVHAAIATDEVVGATNLCNLMAPVTIALCANSPIYDGAPCGAVSAREARMGEIGIETSRHGMPAGPDTSPEEMAWRLATQRHLAMKRDGHIVGATGRFTDHLAGLGDQPELAWEDFLFHEHYIWNSARPRARTGTLEMRAACQQPLHESGAAAALGASLVCAWRELQQLVDDTLGDDAWPAMRAWHARALAAGLAAEEPAPGFLAAVLDRCEAALEARGRDEAPHLAPLRRRLAARTNPAQAALAAFDSGGMPALVAHTARRTATEPVGG